MHSWRQLQLGLIFNPYIFNITFNSVFIILIIYYISLDITNGIANYYNT